MTAMPKLMIRHPYIILSLLLGSAVTWLAGVRLGSMLDGSLSSSLSCWLMLYITYALIVSLVWLRSYDCVLSADEARWLWWMIGFWAVLVMFVVAAARWYDVSVISKSGLRVGLVLLLATIPMNFAWAAPVDLIKRRLSRAS
jgi:hypothetical protein